MYNYGEDLAELNNLFQSEKAIASRMKDELF